MENLLGLLRIQIKRGINLAVRDTVSSDPYVTVRMGKQFCRLYFCLALFTLVKLKTSVISQNINPEWNEDLTLTIADPNLPIKLRVYDKDRFTVDDKMGDAEFDIKPFLEAVKMRLESLPNETIIMRVKPSRENWLAEESNIIWADDKVVQNMILRLGNVERGEVELQLQWIDIPGSRGLH